ncbi:MAG: MaoC family dehydratase [Chloroflexi bacterium]|nr:MaoC family dehydratase [Chloroflexota bacterium]
MGIAYFEDIELGEKESVGNYAVTKEDIIEFARKYDPLPIHLDEEAAKASPHGGLIASACLTMSLSALLLNQRSKKIAIIAGGGWDDVRFPTPVRPGDTLSVDLECVERRESKSKPDRGVVRYKIRMKNQVDEAVLTYKTTIVVSRWHDC